MEYVFMWLLIAYLIINVLLLSVSENFVQEISKELNIDATIPSIIIALFGLPLLLIGLSRKSDDEDTV